MPQASIDQFAVAHGLEKAGFEARQAEAMVRAMNVISGSSEQIAVDITQLRTDTSGLKQNTAQLNKRVGRIEADTAQLKQDMKHMLTREEFERHLRSVYVRLYVTVGAATAFSAGLNFTILQFTLS